jgi:Phosphopantetheine attachment site.
LNKFDVLDEISTIFKNVFDDNDLVITLATNSDEIEDWDSLEQINLLVAIENKFNIKFKIEDVLELENVGDMLELVLSMIGD